MVDNTRKSASSMSQNLFCSDSNIADFMEYTPLSSPDGLSVFCNPLTSGIITEIHALSSEMLQITSSTGDKHL